VHRGEQGRGSRGGLEEVGEEGRTIVEMGEGSEAYTGNGWKGGAAL